MECNQMEQLLSLYIDDMLDEHTKNMIEKHLEECSICKGEYEDLLTTIHLCKQLPMIDLPEGFAEDLHEGLVRATKEEQSEKTKSDSLSFFQRQKKRKWKILAPMAAVFIIMIMTVSSLNNVRMGSMDKSEMAQNEEGSFRLKTESADGASNNQQAPSIMMAKGEMEMKDARGSEEIVENRGNDENNQNIEQGRKVIKNAHIDLEIANYDEKFHLISNRVLSKGGYIDNSNTEYKHYNREKPEESLKMGNLTLRIPEDRFMNTVDEIKSMGLVRNFSMGGQDITASYRDQVNEVENLKVQEQRLREIMKKTKEVKEILEVEKELTRVRGEINRRTGDIKRWDNLVSLSTINISLDEVNNEDQKIKPVSDHMWDKAMEGFIHTANDVVQFFKNLLIGFITILPVILIISILGIPLFLFLKKRKNL